MFIPFIYGLTRYDFLKLFAPWHNKKIEIEHLQGFGRHPREAEVTNDFGEDVLRKHYEEDHQQ